MAAAAVPPIAGGDARYVLNPEPETVEDALSVVNAPAAAVVAPTVTEFKLPVVFALSASWDKLKLLLIGYPLDSS
jgi:hypothetical protein